MENSFSFKPKKVVGQQQKTKKQRHENILNESPTYGCQPRMLFFETLFQCPWLLNLASSSKG